MTKEVYIVRHGQTEYNRLGIWQGSGVDSELNATGWKQAQSFYEYYKDIPFDLLVHSQLKRSKETLSPFLKLGIPTVERAEINEISWGRFEGKPHTEESVMEYKQVISSWEKQDYHIGFTEGESALDLSKRVGQFVDWLLEIEKQKILVCSHGRTIRALLCLMQNEELSEMEKYRHHNTGVFYAEKNHHLFKFHFFNKIDHLQ